MGIPYSRQINAAFEQVTPLVAAGFKVLRTTRDISILLAVIQVLTVFFLGLILSVLVVLCYCVNPDLEAERKQLITPWLKYFASITLWGIIKTAIASAFLLGGAGWLVWKMFLVKQWIADVEFEGNVDADKALEDLNDDADVQKKAKEGKEAAKKEEEKRGKKM